MKQAYRNENIGARRLTVIELANGILEAYKADGYRLTLRQLYYQMVARDLIPNQPTEYKKLGAAMVQARMNGLTDWDMIEDRLRKPQHVYWVSDIPDAIEDTVRHYRLNRQQGQERKIEVWTEKDAVSNILLRVTQYFHIQLMVNRGYSSCSAMRDAYFRIGDKSNTIIYVGDHDPSGLDMIRDMDDRLDEFGEAPEIVHIALTRDQIDEYTPPPNPAKITDPRAKWYIAAHGPESWELDALDPNTLHDIVYKAVEDRINLIKFAEMLRQEDEDKIKLKEIAAKVKDGDLQK